MQFGNEEIVVTILLGTTLTLFFAIVIVFLFALFNNKNKLNILDKERTKKAFERALLQAQLEIKEQTLQHIAYELHDNLGQIASLIKINLNTLQFNDLPKAEQKIQDTKELVRQLITDLKLLSLSLTGDVIAKVGIIKGLENEVEKINRTGLFTALLEQDGIIPSLDANTTIILYRMSQEIINNIVKHSGARHIKILLRSTKNIFTLAYSDDGEGFNINEKLKSGGAGLLNLQSRAKLINAQLFINSTPDAGTTITIELPI